MTMICKNVPRRSEVRGLRFFLLSLTNKYNSKDVTNTEIVRSTS